MSKKITFGRSECGYVDFNTKTKVIDFLYSKLDLSKYRFLIISESNKLNTMKNEEYYVSPNFNGYNYFIIFINVGGKTNCIAIDRRKLSYHKDKLDIKSILMFQIPIKTTDAIYKGTIFDGKLINSGSETIFLIQDCYYLMGNKLYDMEMKQKSNYLDTIFKTHFSNDCCECFDFKLNKLYEYPELRDLINDIIPNIKLHVNGLIFYPKLSGINKLFIEKKVEKVEITSTSNEVIESKSIKIIEEFVDFLKNRSYSYEDLNSSKPKDLWVYRTDIPDVYEISEKENGDKSGIVLIPNLKISHMCDELIDDKPVKFTCLFSKKFNKWIPIKQT